MRHEHRWNVRVRRTGAALVALSAMLIAPIAPTAPSAASERPVPPERSSVALGGVDPRARQDLTSSPKVAAGLKVAALSSPIGVGQREVVGVTWSADTLSGEVGDLLVRTRDDGRWSAWEELHVDESHAPDGSTLEGRRARRGSAPLVVSGADDVQVRVATASGRAPRGLRVELIDPGRAAADANAAAPTATATATETETATAVRPTIRTRAEWGADESIRKGAPAYGTVDVGFVHHTAGSNSYAAEDVPGIIRGIYAYHVTSLGWNDIGYSFLVDKWGRLWEGRAGGVDRPVIGAHTRGYNAHSFALATLGDHQTAPVPEAVDTAYTTLFAWKLGLSHVDPTKTTTLTDADGSPTKVFRNISGHRDFADATKATECPGQALYERIEPLRPRVRSAQGAMFYRPLIDRPGWRRGDPGGVTVRASASAALTWSLEVRSAGESRIVATRTGSATSGSGLVARWDGLIDGLPARDGSFDLTLTATSGEDPTRSVPPWRTTVVVTDPVGDLLDRTRRHPPRGPR
ncbi:hypothetical protein N802_18720 [Knoellia sinensis KCTC 19936]|uniref:Peptidoglycan recognition protein family domain-containing protein n=1 Tax=Knoellia sinensis KCTC 19936 TaxID=1385520 RepID=A0A0A0J501_9MICO|nr:N-acetylmuramoyl-L-alanine amidase [Knoellia sinensis]KGN32400.1 hypothetical protein N802_18720 [Knoellia sinensis KCTC 19936]